MERQHFVTLVKFASGKGPKDLEEFAQKVDERLKSMPSIKKTRHEMDIHEQVTYTTLGRYDAVMVWDAPNMDTALDFLIEWVNSCSEASFGSTETLPVISRMNYRLRPTTAAERRQR